jgi:hypothetical protein
MHNQLYEYFRNMGARWMKRPFQNTLAKKVLQSTMEDSQTKESLLCARRMSKFQSTIDSRMKDEPSVITSFGNRSPAREIAKQRPEAFKMHPIDTARSPSSGYMSFASSEGADLTTDRSFGRHSLTDRRSPTELEYIYPSGSQSDDSEESPPLNRPPTKGRAPTPEQKCVSEKGRAPSPEQQAVSEVASSAVTVQHNNTPHLMRSNTKVRNLL